MASIDYQVLTPERVSLQYDIAGVGSRGAAALVDAFIQGFGMFLLYLAFIGALVTATVSGGANSPSIFIIEAILILAVFVLTIGYPLIFEILWSGQTPGKRVVGLRVIRENGYPIRPVDAIIRNLLRLVDGLPIFYALGVITMLLNPRWKRLGDFAAGTIVIREGERGSTTLFSLRPTTDADEPRGPRLSNEDATLVRDFLSRRAALDPAPRQELAQRLANALAARYGLLLDAEPEIVLERLVA